MSSEHPLICPGGLIQIVRLIRPEIDPAQYKRSFERLFTLLGKTSVSQETKKVAIYNINIYELGAMILEEIKDLKLRGLPLNDLDLSLAQLIFKIVQVNNLLLVSQITEKQQSQQFKDSILKLLTKVRQEGLQISKLPQLQTIQNITIVTTDMYDLLKYTLNDRVKYLQITSHHDMNDSLPFVKLKFIFLNILRIIRKKIKKHLECVNKGNATDFVKAAEKLSIKITYFYVETARNLERIQQDKRQNAEQIKNIKLSNTQILTNQNGIKNLMNYLEEAPYSILKEDYKYLKGLMDPQMKKMRRVTM